MNLKPKDLAERWHVSTGTLANWRVRGEGPRYLKFGRKVLYRLKEIEAFEEKILRENTAQ